MGKKIGKDNPLTFFNKIVSFSSLKPIDNFVLIQSNIFINRESYDEFNDLIRELKNKYNKLDKLSYYSFYKLFIDFLYNILIGNKEATKPELSNFINEIENKFPIVNIKVVSPIWGIFIDSNNSLKIGGFEIFSKNKYRPHFGYEYSGPSFDFFISTNVDARDHEYAESLQNENLEKFEFAIRYILGLESHKYSISVTESFQIQKLRYFEGSPKGIIRNEQIYVAPHDLLNLNQEFILNSRVWKILSNPTNEFERRLNNAILWIGKAIGEIDLTKGFIQYFFGLESVLQRDNKFWTFH